VSHIHDLMRKSKINNGFRLSFKPGEEVKYVKIIQQVHFNYTYFYIFSLDMKSISQLMWNIGKVCDTIWGKKDERRTEAKQQDAGEGEEDGEDERVF